MEAALKTMSIASYEEALAFVEGLNIALMKQGLSRISNLCELLGHPENKVPVIHIAGTNGKGSVATILSRILKAAGYRVGTFTSPHLLDVRERIRINGEMISETAFTAEVAVLQKQFQPLDDEAWPTYFEFMTLLAYRYFAAQELDMVVMEVGLGGRLDATNVVKQPLMSVITNISYDHQDRLGYTLSEIANEKAGIIKSGSLVVLGPRIEGDPMKVISEKASEMHAPLVQADKERLSFISAEPMLGLELLDNKTREVYRLTMLGQYQRYNLSTVFTILEQLNQKGFDIHQEHVRAGLFDIKWPVRFDYRSEEHMLLDGGHNVEGMAMLKEGLGLYFQNEQIVWLVSLRDNRPVGEMLEVIESWPNTVGVICVTGPKEYLYHDAKTLAEAMKAHKKLQPVVAKDVADGFQRLRQIQDKHPGSLAVVCGSMYTAAEVLRMAEYSTPAVG